MTQWAKFAILRDIMSAHNGDKSRYGRQRKAKINRRQEMRALRRAIAQGKSQKSK